MSPGKFITFEGGEGAGKSTQAKYLADYLEQQGFKVILTREPGGSPGAELIRNLLVTGGADKWSAEAELLLMYAARADHWQKRIHPALDQGYWVVCDRFADSSVAYQGYGRGLDLDFLNLLYKKTVGDRNPDRTYVFDIAPHKGLGRAAHRFIDGNKNEDRFESFDLSFHERVHQGFLTIAQQNQGRCLMVDANQSIQQIQDLIRQDICSYL
ncbi:dTMP kinase [Candidatus Finniella inopinata]|uniref:Thymidylate kinase n=1 Tax=Candidatus Finniella inopinata TaxID=1696036 RepID=A0A4V2DZX8_9PROT|nr:dTMP kinase [Candidatus Finniella inopinata]RZI46607.1 dTMP kinase [Candidatus Finniella inopinata]